MNALFDLCRVHTPTSGTGTIALGNSVSGYLDFAGAGVPDGATVSYGIKDIAASEAGAGVYNAAAGTLTRSVYKSTGVGHNTPIALSGSAEVFITALAEDFWTGGPFLPLSGGVLTGPIATTGPNAAYAFDDRTTTARWFWYADGGNAYLNLTGPGHRLAIDTSGNVTATGSLTFSGGAGIQYDYQPPTSGVGLNYIAFGWDGGTILASVDATGIPGKLATQAWVGGAYLPLAGGTLSGQLNINQGHGSNLALYDDGNSHIESSTDLWLNSNGNPVLVGGPLYAQSTGTFNGPLQANAFRAGTVNLGGQPWSVINSTFNTLANSGAMGVGWNYSAGGGEIDFFLNRDGGGVGGAGGGLKIYDFPNTAATPALLMRISGVGALGVANELPDDIAAGNILAGIFTSNSTATTIFNNVYQPISGPSKFLTTGPGTAINTAGGEIDLYTAASGTAGTQPSWFQMARFTSGGIATSGSITAGINGVISGGGMQIANAHWLYGVDTGGSAVGLLTLWSDNNVYVNQTDRGLSLRGSVILIGDASGNLAQFSHADAPAPSIANFTPTRWRLAVHAGDDGNAGAIGYRDFDPNCLGIVGAGTAGGTRLVKIWDQLYVTGNINTQAGGNLYLSGGFIFLNGATGGGPLITADNSNMQFNLGPSNGYFAFASNDSAWKAWIHSDGSALFGGGVTTSGVTIIGTDHLIYDAGGGVLNIRVGPSGGPDAYFSFRNTGEFDAQGTVVCTSVHTTGGGSILFFDDRTSGTSFGWYGSANVARLWNNSFGDLFEFNTQGWLYPGQGNNQGLIGIGGNAFAAMNAYAFNNVSDIRDKRDLEDLPDCLPIVARLNPQRFKWAHGPDTERTHWGFVAQDVGAAMADRDFGGHQIDPESGTQSLSYHELTAVLWKAVQELATKVDAIGVAA